MSVEEKKITPGSVVKKRTPEQQRLKNIEMSYQTRAFAMILEIVAIFGVPALAVVIAYHQLYFSREILYVLLFLAFIFSWWVTLLRVRKMKDMLQGIRTKREAIEDIDTTPIIDEEEEKSF